MIKIYLIIDSYGWVQEKRAQKFIKLEKKYKKIKYQILDLSTFKNNFEKFRTSNSIFYIMSWRILDSLDLENLRILKNRTIIGVTSHYNLGGLKNNSKCLTQNISNLLRLKKTFQLLNSFKYISVNSLILYRYLKTKINGKIFYTPNGVDEKFFSISKNKIKEQALVGWTGKIKTAKNFELLKKIKEKFSKDIQFEYKIYQRKKNFLSRLNFFKGNDIKKFYSKIHFYICVSWHEGTPNPCLEALSCGIPVITTKVGNMPDIIKNGFNGFFINHNFKSIKIVIKKILKLSQKDYEMMSSNSRKSILNSWTWNKQYKKVRKMILEVSKNYEYDKKNLH
jgi:glycosyltransferase involved in cell wall biosynthesis